LAFSTNRRLHVVLAEHLAPQSRDGRALGVRRLKEQ
jgi:hypothetical protein